MVPASFQSPHTPPTWIPHPSFLCSQFWYMPLPLPEKTSLWPFCLEKPSHPSRTSSEVTSSVKAPWRRHGTSSPSSVIYPSHAYEVSVPVSQRPPRTGWPWRRWAYYSLMEEEHTPWEAMGSSVTALQRTYKMRALFGRALRYQGFALVGNHQRTKAILWLFCG